MAEASLKLGGGNWGVKEDSLLGFNDENGNYKPIPFDFSRASIGTRVNRDGLIETVQDNIPRIDFSGDGSLLLEPQRTNLVADSTDLTNASFWFKYSLGNGVNPIITSDYAISPDGTQNASRVELDAVGTGSADRSRLYTTISTTSGTDYTFSFYAKSNTGGNQYIRPRAQDVLYDQITITNEWQRFDVSFNAISTGSLQYGFEIRGNFTENSADILIYGVQLEAGAYPTSLIPTSGSAVTRVSDESYANDQLNQIGQTEGTIYAEFKIPEGYSGTDAHRFQLSDNTTNNWIFVSVNNGNDSRVYYRAGANTQIDYTVSDNLFTAGTTHKIAFAYKNGDSAYYVDGVQKQTWNSALNNPTSELDVYNITGSSPTYNNSPQLMSNNLKQTMIFKTRLSNAELAELTS